MKSSRQYNVVDLFCGAGGFSLGFQWAKFKNVFSVEYDPVVCETYRHNFKDHKLIECNIEDLSNDCIKELIRETIVDVVIGGPPCQGFSIAGNIGRKFIEDPRNTLFKEFIRVVNIIRPRCFVMENVSRLYTREKGKIKNEILECFRNIGYEVEARVVQASEYGIPQNRSRVFFIGRERKGEYTPLIIFPEKLTSKSKTIKDAIDRFPPLKNGETSNIPNHKAMNHSSQMIEKMSYIRDGGTREDIPENIRPKTGDVRKYIRYNSSQPSICITGDMRKVFHYNQNRALTVRELAAIQSYPDEFVFLGNQSIQQQMVGNSVPPLLAKAIAEAVKKMLV